MEEQRDYIQRIYDELMGEFNSEEIGAASGVFNNPIFKKVVDKVIEVKSKIIIDEVETKEELELARYTLKGNAEIPELFGMINSSIERGTDEKFDRHEVIE